MNQVLEHVRQPWLLFPEIERVLTKNGLLVGSVSQLEPYHSFSLYNYTYYGICDFCDQFGLRVFRLRPGIDGIQIIQRSFNKFILKRDYTWEDKYFAHESPLNYALETFLAGRNPREINRAKLHTAGHFCFAARKSAWCCSWYHLDCPVKTSFEKVCLTAVSCRSKATSFINNLE